MLMFVGRQRLGWMLVAITFCDQTKYERRENEHGYSFFHWSQAESLPDFIEFETPVLLNHE
jgi:hypothetical protein